MLAGSTESSQSTSIPVKAVTCSLESFPNGVEGAAVSDGNSTDDKVLTDIAEAGQGSNAKGNQSNIVSVFQDIGAFF